MSGLTCFFVYPFGKEGSKRKDITIFLHDHLLRPILTECGFTEFGDSNDYATEKITPKMIELLTNSDLCIVDITGLNANVLWEFGFRCALERPVIVIKQKNKASEDATKENDFEMPFNIGDYRVIQYLYEPENTQHTLKAARETQKEIKKQIEDRINQGFHKTARTSVEWIKDINRQLGLLEQIARKVGVLDQNIHDFVSPDKNESKKLTSI